MTSLVKENSTRVKVKNSEFYGFSEINIFEEPINYLMCSKCHCCIKKNTKMINVIDAHKSNCEFYPKKPRTFDVHKLCLRKDFISIILFDLKINPFLNLNLYYMKSMNSCGEEKIMPWSKFNPKNKIESKEGKKAEIFNLTIIIF